MARHLGWALGVAWTAAVAGSLLWNGWREAVEIEELARQSLRASFDRDLLYRRWTALQGGVYVPVTEATPPNPHLGHVPERDIETPSGRRLTLVNPAYLTRQVYEMEQEKTGSRGHLTSLHPLRRENAPDPWEAQSLKAFERGQPEISVIALLDGEPHMRLMRPLVAEEACLSCHASPGDAAAGGVRGGISVSAPMAPYMAVAREQRLRLVTAHALLWLGGLGGIALLTRRLKTAARKEKAIREELRATLYGIGDGVIATDPEGRVVRMNVMAESLTGWSEAEALGRPLEQVFRIVNEETRDTVENPVQKVLRDGRVVGIANHTLLVARGGAEFPIADSAAPVQGDSGRTLGVVLVFRDQTEERTAEETLRQSEARFRLLFEHMLGGLALHEVICDGAGKPVDYRFLEVNPAFERLTGLAAERIIGKTVLEVLPQTEAHWIDTYGRVALTGEPAHFQDYSQGLDRYYEVNAYSPRRGQFAVIFDEVTDRRRAEVEREITVDLLRLLNAPNDLPRLAKDVTALMHEWSGCGAVAIRLREGEDYPYFESTGFPPGFVEDESCLRGRETDGAAIRSGGAEGLHQGLCGHVLHGRIDATRPFFTEGGSFWVNSTGDLLAAETEAGLPPGVCNRCTREGYESVALVPLRSSGETFGLLQFSDRRRNRFSPGRIALFERLADNLAVGLSQRRAAAELARRADLDGALAELSAQLLEPGKLVEEVALLVLRRAQTLTGSAHGMVASVDPRTGESVGHAVTQMFGRDCLNLDPGADATLRTGPDGRYPGLWGHCLNTLEPFLTNAPSRPLALEEPPEEHAPVRNFLAVPVMVEGGLLGQIALANSPRDFLTEDLEAVRRLGDLYGMFLRHWRIREALAERDLQFRQAQKMEAVGRLAGGVAHDFNNMLQVILGYTDLALEEASPESALAEGLRHVREAAEHSAELTRQLLAFARRQTIAPRVLDLNDTISDLLKMLGRLVSEEIDLVWKPSRKPGLVRMDPAQLTQILTNLVINARDAISEVGSVTIETGRAAFDRDYCDRHAGIAPGRYLLLAVSDSGCGMDQETQTHLFEPFFTTKSPEQGTGLGLATVFGIVKQNDGFINVYSEPGCGTSVKIYLPRLEDETAEKSAVRPSGELPRGSETVLLVEDEGSLLKLGTVLLEGLGYTVLAADSPRRALELAEEPGREIQLLITDVVMPGMSGRDLQERLRPAHPGLKFLFMSGYTANVIAPRGVLDEGVHFLQKPFSVAALAAKAREALED